MSWTTAIQDFRIHMSDGPTDKLFSRQRCLYETNGTNTRFKTFEMRRVTNFTVDGGNIINFPNGLGIYQNGNLLLTSQISSDDPLSGEFILGIVPNDGDIIEASYYTQWFLDSEVDNFFKQASLWIGSVTDYVNGVTPGLIPAALEYAAFLGYKKMAEKWRNFLSSGYRLEDAPKADASNRVQSFTQCSEKSFELSERLRAQFYTRQDQPLQPLFSISRGRVRQMP